MDLCKKRSCPKSYFGKNNPIADVFLSSDIARLIDLTEAGANYEIPFSQMHPAMFNQNTGQG